MNFEVDGVRKEKENLVRGHRKKRLLDQANIQERCYGVRTVENEES